MVESQLLSIGELARRAGISRRTVRFYVQRGLVPEPLGRGRGGHYDAAHLAAVLRVKALQLEGHTLESIRAIVTGEAQAPGLRPGRLEEDSGPGTAGASTRRQDPGWTAPGQRWFRQQLLPGYELHIQDPHPPFTEDQLNALARCIYKLMQSGGD